MHVKIAGYGRVRLTANPGHCAPTMTARGEDFAQGGGHHFDLRMLLHHAINHAEEGARIELRPGCDLRTRNAESGLQILFVSHEHIHILDDATDGLEGAIPTARALPEFLAKVQIKRSDCARRFCRLHPLDN